MGIVILMALEEDTQFKVTNLRLHNTYSNRITLDQVLLQGKKAPRPSLRIMANQELGM